jgi:hypothetical protein
MRCDIVIPGVAVSGRLPLSSNAPWPTLTISAL